MDIFGLKSHFKIISCVIFVPHPFLCKKNRSMIDVHSRGQARGKEQNEYFKFETHIKQLKVLDEYTKELSAQGLFK